MSDASFTRFALDGNVRHRNGQQFVDGKGFGSDRFEDVHRVEPHGFASYPVKGGIGAILQSRGNRDSAYAFGGENPKLRPELDPGCTALYDQHGGILKFITSGAVFDVGSRTVTFTAGGWTVNGPCTINGDLQVNGNINASGSIIDATGNSNHHSH